MATPTSSYAPVSSSGGVEDSLTVKALGAATSSAEIVIGVRQIFEVWGTQQINIRFGPAGLGAATNADYGIPANVVRLYETSEEFSSVRVFNNGLNPADIYIMRLARGR